MLRGREGKGKAYVNPSSLEGDLTKKYCDFLAWKHDVLREGLKTALNAERKGRTKAEQRLRMLTRLI